MARAIILRFDRFRFDAGNVRLEDEAGPLRLNPKAFDVLRVLIDRRGELVSKDDLLDTVWPDTHVADGVLKVCMAEIRAALGDSATEPRFIETVYRRGYRFIAAVVEAAHAESIPTNGDGFRVRRSVFAWPAGDGSRGESRGVLVGRARELELLEERLVRALGGERQVVFVTGEPGAGKTSLVEHFAVRAARAHALAVTGGQCLEQFGSAEAYMPVLVLGTTRDRMLREVAEFVEALGAEMPFVLVLEDLHWSDPSMVRSRVAARRAARARAPARDRDLSARGPDSPAPPATGSRVATHREPPRGRGHRRGSRGRGRGGVSAAALSGESLPA